MRGYDAIAEELLRHDVECAFTLMGEDVAELLVAMDLRGIRCYGARHENQAVAMADSYARSTGKLGVAVLTGGPGFTNAMTAIVTATRARSSVLIVVGAGQTAEDDPARRDLRLRKYFPHAGVGEAAGFAVVKPAASASVVTEARTAMLASAAGGTTVLNLAVDVLDSEVTEPSALDTVLDEPARLAPDPDAIVAVADYLQENWAVSRPVILAGYGALASGADVALRRLGTLTGSLMSTTLRAAGLFDDDPYTIGICGTFATPGAAELLARSDCVLAFGATLNRYTTYGGAMFPNARVIQVDDDLEAFGRFAPIERELAVHADVRLSAEALVAELERRGHEAGGYRAVGIPLGAELDRDSALRDQSLPDRIDPRTLMRELDRMLPANRVLALDNGHNFTFAVEHIRVRGPRSIVQLSDAGSIGLGIGTAVGAAVGRPDATVVLSVGDAGFLMALGDLETAVRYELPLVIVICNDEALGMEVHFLELIGLPTKLAKLPTPSLANIASAVGAEAFTVRSIDDLDAVEERLRHPLSGPLVLDCRINGEVRADWLEFAIGHRAPRTLRSAAT